MMLPRRLVSLLSIAWSMLTADRAKYAGLLGAVAFATLMLQNQTSIFAGILMRTAHQVLDVSEADVWVMRPGTSYFDEVRGLPDASLDRVRSVPEIAWAVPLRKRNVSVVTADGSFRQAIVLGIDDASLVGLPRRMVLGQAEDLRMPDAAIIDRAGYLQLYPHQPLRLGDVLECAGQRLRIVGISEASAPFAPFPIVHVRGSAAARMPAPEREDVSFIVARSAQGTAPESAASAITAATGLRARSTSQFAWDCIRFYLANTGIPVNFGITIALAVLIGAAVAGLTFSLFIRDNLQAFAALKAIGLTDADLLTMSAFQALSVTGLGAVLGTGMSTAFFAATSGVVATRGIALPWWSVIGASATIAVVVLVVSALAMRQVLRVDPAEVFRT